MIKKLISTRVGLLGLVIVLAASTTGGLVHADQYTQQIQAIEAQNAIKQQALGNLQIEANSYQDAINKLQSRINQIEGLILKTQSQQTAVKRKIADAQKQLDHQKLVLGEAIKSMYIESETSTLEVLLSSDNLSDFVTQEQYHITVQNNVKSLVDKITTLKQQLKAQNDKLTQLLTDQRAQQSQVLSARAEQDKLLNYNQDQQTNFSNKIASNNARIESLRAQQAAAYAAYGNRSGVSMYGAVGNGGYPDVWANAEQDTIGDDWGMLNRECVSYVAWKVDFMTHNMPYWGGYDIYGPGTDTGGHAYQWVNNARFAHIPMGSSPRVGSAAVWGHDDGMGWLGHVAYVDIVNGDGSIEVSQYNVIHGRFNRMHVSSSIAHGLSYIYFGG